MGREKKKGQKDKIIENRKQKSMEREVQKSRKSKQEATIKIFKFVFNCFIKYEVNSQKSLKCDRYFNME